MTLCLESRVAYPELGDYCEIAAELSGTSPREIEGLPRIDLVEAALAAPQACFGEHDAYPTLIEKAAVLIDRLAPIGPLPGASKRAALLTVRLFMELNGRPFSGQSGQADTDIPMVERIAAGEATIGEISLWLERRA
jgi:prophage maintenance system killer protein